MCRKDIYYNTYVDGEKDITERVTVCTPGFMCAHPLIQEYQRNIAYSRAQYRSGRASVPGTMDRHLRPPTPGSLTPPGSRGSDTERHARLPNVVKYINGVRVVDVPTPERSPRRRERASAVPHAPEPPAPRPIPIKRASTMPYSTEPAAVHQRGRRPIIIEERAPPATTTATRHLHHAMPPTTSSVEVEHASSTHLHRRSSRREAASADLLSPYRQQHSRSPQGYGSAEEEQERRERRRRRREARTQAAVLASSVPTFGNTDNYGSSFGSSYGSSSNGSSAAPSPVVGPSPAVTAVKKELRWEDQMRAEQNARIRQRPKLSRAASMGGAGAGAGVQGEVKSILKNSPTNLEQQAAASKRDSLGDDDLAELYRSVEGLSLQERETSTQRRSREAEEKDSSAYMDRLRNRFSMPPRRYTAGTGSKRRTEIWYPDEGRYKYKN